MIEKSQSLKSKKTDEEKDFPSHIPIIPIKGFLRFWGIFTSTPIRANTATKKAGPKTQGKGNNKTLKIVPPKAPIKSVLIRVLNFFKIILSMKLI